MEDNLILEGLLSMVTELKEKLEAQVTPASREETLERLGTIEQALSELHSNSAVPEEKLQVIFNGVDIKAYENGTHGKVTRADLNIPEDAFVVGMVGRSFSNW